LETIQKRVSKNLGKKRTPEQKLRMSDAQKGREPRKYSTEQQIAISKKISDALKGIPKSAEHKQKLSDALKGKLVGDRSEDTKQKMRKPKSEDHKSNMRKPKSPEHIQAIISAKAKKKLL
jgi:hypothetical protein